MSILRPLFFGCCLVLGVTGCKSADPVQEFCETVISCDCSMPFFADVDGCVTAFNANIDDLKKEAAALGLVYDDSCADDTLSTLQDYECKGPLDVSVEDALSFCPCAPIHGSVAAGAACSEKEGGWSDCGRGLECRSGVCVDPCKVYKAGETCVIIMGDDVDASGRCESGLYCDFDSATCKPLADAGSTCASFDGCKSGLSCNPATMKCEELPKNGEDCTVVCDQGYVCTDGTCAAGPGEGEPCADFGCGPNLYCDEDDTCVGFEPLLCSSFGL